MTKATTDYAEVLMEIILFLYLSYCATYEGPSKSSINLVFACRIPLCLDPELYYDETEKVDSV